MGAYKQYVHELFEAAQSGDRNAARTLLREGGCPYCFGAERTHDWVRLSDGRLAIKVRCTECRRFLQWAPQTQEFIALAAGNGALSPRAGGT